MHTPIPSACALKKIDKNADAVFFNPDVFAAGRRRHPVLALVPLLRAAWSETVKKIVNRQVKSGTDE